jgi:uncharacterized cupin superfamily protein
MLSARSARRLKEVPMIEEARLEPVASGLTPVTPGWFVVNAREAAWMNNDQTESCCIFESDDFVLRGRPDLTEYEKPEAGFVLRVLRPGRPTGFYHAESVQEDFLVLTGECILIIEDQERHLRAWDFVHCPPGTGHTFVGAGEGPCVLLCAGNREPDETFWRICRRSDVALQYGASVEHDVNCAEANVPWRHRWRVERPETWTELPWSSAS